MSSILCLGSAIVDITAWPVDFARLAQDHQGAERLMLGSGGCAGNVSIGLASLGKAVHLIARVGCDAMGDLVTDLIKKRGVQTELMIRDSQGETGKVIVLVDEGAERRFIYSPGVNAAFCEQDLAGVNLARDLVHVSDYFLLPKLIGKPMANILARARQQGALTSLDTIFDPDSRWLPALADCLPHLDYLFVSDDETRHLFPGLGPEQVLEELCQRGSKTVILKRGERGVMLRSGSLLLEEIPPQVTPVDSTGAGDAFVAAFLAATLEQLPLKMRLRAATNFAVGSLFQLGANSHQGYDSAAALLKGEPK